MHSVRGRLITFEGIDGSGKTTQLRLLEARFVAAGHQVLATREPGGTALGRQLREALLAGDPGSVDPLAELLLYAADRAHHVRQLIRPALDEGTIVLCDRYADATVAYQGYGRGFSLDLICQLNELATGGLMPALTLIYDLPVEVGLARIGQRQSLSGEGPASNRLDRESVDFHSRVREAYHALAAAEPERCRLIPAAGSIEETFALTLSAIGE